MTKTTHYNSLKSLVLSLSFLAAVGCAPAGEVGPAAGDLPDDPHTEETLPEADRPAQSGEPNPQDQVDAGQEKPADDIATSGTLSKYAHLDPNHIVPTELLKAAVLYFDKNQSKILNKNYISVIDFSKSSKKRRFFIIDMKAGSVFATTVAHGKGSDANHDSYLDKFSNVNGSNASSQGYYLTAETYHGSHGLSLRLDGLSSTNSNVRKRAVVIHGASYVVDKEVKQGRSWGCPAVPMAYRDRIINMIKGKSLIYAM